MSQSILFATYLNDLMISRKISLDHLTHELGYRHSAAIKIWLEGRSRPPLQLLPEIARILHADPVEMSVGWIIDQVPEFGAVFRAEVLDPRKSTFPHPDDLTLRMPKPFRF